jgi:hypothetical protein
MPAQPLTIEVKGLEQIRANLRNLYERAPAEFGQAVREEFEDAMMESQAECPYDYDNPHSDGTPHMRDTALVEGPVNEGNGFAVYASYAVPYATVQHETPEYNHIWPTKWKFLEDPINRRIPRIAPAIVKRMELILQGVNERMHFLSPRLALRDYRRAVSRMSHPLVTSEKEFAEWMKGRTGGE